VSRGFLMDSDVAIDYLRDVREAARFVESNLERILISVITGENHTPLTSRMP